VDETERERKLDMIASQTGEELIGWYRAVFVSMRRAPFDGEASAIMRRAKSLNIDLSKHREAI
jgi:hypothetical protein